MFGRKKIMLIGSVLASLAVMLLGPGAAHAGTSSAGPTGDGFGIQAGPFWWGNLAGSNSAGTRKVLDIKGDGRTDGVVVQLWTYHDRGNQLFYSIPDGGTSLWKLQGVNSHRCLDLLGPNSANGTQVHQWNCYPSTNQRWRQEAQGTRVVLGVSLPVYRFVNQYANKCLDNTLGSGTDGNKIQIWTCNGSDNQLWF